MSELDELALAFAQLASSAGLVVMDVYATDFAVRRKADASPVSEADEAAEALLVPGVEKLLPGVPILAEEAVSREGLVDVGSEFVLIDPLDGTKEFVRGGDDYTVNIGLIVDGVPRLGVVFQPARDRLWGGVVGRGAFVEQGHDRVTITTRPLGAERAAVASKSHFNQATADYLEQAIGMCSHVAVGSSLKFCVVAEGRADIYPRLSPTSEWDTAAGHAVLLAAGGRCDGPDGKPLGYGKKAFLNRGFIATSGWEPPPIGPYLTEFSGGGDLPQGV